MNIRSNSFSDKALRSLACALLGVGFTQLPACGGKTQQNKPRAGNDRQVMSGSPTVDAAAFGDSENELTQIRYGVLERRGPKSVGTLKPPDKKKLADAVNGEEKLGDPTAKASRFRATPPEDLPLQEIELPGDRVKFIWTLRSYGGVGISSTRDDRTSRRNVTIKPADLTPLVAVIKEHLGEAGTVTPLPSENAVVITCDKSVRDTMISLLDRLDMPAMQVEITAKIFEVSHDFDFQQGAQVLAERVGSDNAQTGLSSFNTSELLNSIAENQPFQGSVVTLMKTFESAGVSVDASLEMLAEEGLIRMVSAPRLTVAAGQTGYMLAGQELPIQSANVNNNVLQTSTQYKPVGVQLYITPQAVGGDRIKLHTISIVSSVSGFVSMPTLTGKNDAQGLINPVIDSREAETSVTIENGDTLVISGLRMVRTTTREAKVPVLGDIPVMGWLFKNHRSQQQMTDLYFFVTPKLLEVAAIE